MALLHRWQNNIRLALVAYRQVLLGNKWVTVLEKWLGYPICCMLAVELEMVRCVNYISDRCGNW